MLKFVLFIISLRKMFFNRIFALISISIDRMNRKANSETNRSKKMNLRLIKNEAKQSKRATTTIFLLISLMLLTWLLPQILQQWHLSRWPFSISFRTLCVECAFHVDYQLCVSFAGGIFGNLICCICVNCIFTLLFSSFILFVFIHICPNHLQ